MFSGFIARNKVKLIGTGLGALAGFFYYYYVGCPAGTCLIASNPGITVPYFALLGFLFTGILKE